MTEYCTHRVRFQCNNWQFFQQKTLYLEIKRNFESEFVYFIFFIQNIDVTILGNDVNIMSQYIAR